MIGSNGHRTEKIMGGQNATLDLNPLKVVTGFAFRIVVCQSLCMGADNHCAFPTQVL